MLSIKLRKMFFWVAGAAMSIGLAGMIATSPILAEEAQENEQVAVDEAAENEQMMAAALTDEVVGATSPWLSPLIYYKPIVVYYTEGTSEETKEAKALARINDSISIYWGNEVVTEEDYTVTITPVNGIGKGGDTAITFFAVTVDLTESAVAQGCQFPYFVSGYNEWFTIKYEELEDNETPPLPNLPVLHPAIYQSYTLGVLLTGEKDPLTEIEEAAKQVVWAYFGGEQVDEDCYTISLANTATTGYPYSAIIQLKMTETGLERYYVSEDERVVKKNITIKYHKDSVHEHDFSGWWYEYDPYYHFRSCVICWAESDERIPHNYVNGKCTVCNHAEPANALNGMNCDISISGEVGINFFLKLSDDVYKNGHVSFYNKKTGQYLSWNGNVMTTDQGYRYQVFMDVKNLSDPIEIRVSDGQGNKVSLAGYYDTTDYSIANYLEKIKPKADEYTKTVAEALENYSAYARAYFKYDVPETLPEIGDCAIECSDKSITGTMPEGIEYLGTSLVLKDLVEMRFYFYVEGSIDDYKIESPSFGMEQFGTNSPFGGTPVKVANNLYYIPKKLIYANAFRTPVDLTVSKAGDENSAVIKYSPANYSQDAQYGDSPYLKELTACMYQYGVAVEEYITRGNR